MVLLLLSLLEAQLSVSSDVSGVVSVRLPEHAAALGDDAAAAAGTDGAQLSVSSDASGVVSCCGCRRMRRAWGDDAAAASAAGDGTTFLLKRCERRGFPVRLPEHAPPLGVLLLQLGKFRVNLCDVVSWCGCRSMRQHRDDAAEASFPSQAM